MMDNLKDKYQMRFFLSTVGFVLTFICAFYAIYYLESIFVIIPLILIDVTLAFISYQSLMYRLAIRKKFKVVYENKLNLNEVYQKKLENKNKNTIMLNKVFMVSLYASPIVMVLGITIGIFIANSVILAIVLPAFIICYLIVLFFVKDIYESNDYNEEKEAKEVVSINDKSIAYKGSLYIFNYCGFHFKNDTYKFLFIPLAKPKFDDETKKQIEDMHNEASDK